jgi:hypothetical protein
MKGKAAVVEKRPVLGRVKNHLKMGIVGLCTGFMCSHLKVYRMLERVVYSIC